MEKFNIAIRRSVVNRAKNVVKRKRALSKKQCEKKIGGIVKFTILQIVFQTEESIPNSRV